MARPIDFVRKEIVRVASELGKDPRSVSRDELLTRSEVTSHDLYFLGGLAGLRRDAANCNAIAPDADAVAVRGVQLRNQYVSGLEKSANSNAYFAGRLEDALVRAMERSPFVPSTPAGLWKRVQSQPAKRELVALISDTHFGLTVDPREVPGNAYTWQVAARRLAKVVDQLATWKPSRRDATDLRLCIAGDLIQGAIHVISEGSLTLLTEQVHGTTQMLVQAIDYLRHHYRRIRIVCTPGNHDRHVHRGGRASSAKWDGLATMVHTGLRYAFRQCEDVSIEIPRTPYGTFELVGGHLAYVTHGDTVTATGNLGRSINVEKITRQIYAIDASGVLPKPISVAMMGHVHVPAYTQLQNGCNLVVNGCLSGTDPYAQSIGIFASHPAQVIFEATDAHPVGDFRILRLKDADADPRYDDIIVPPSLELDRTA